MIANTGPVGNHVERECMDCHYYWESTIIGTGTSTLDQCPVCGSFTVMRYDG